MGNSTVTKQWYEIGQTEVIPSPALLVYPDCIEENIRRMISVAGGYNEHDIGNILSGNWIGFLRKNWKF
jgi:hypothetical protein